MAAMSGVAAAVPVVALVRGAASGTVAVALPCIAAAASVRAAAVVPVAVVLPSIAGEVSRGWYVIVRGADVDASLVAAGAVVGVTFEVRAGRSLWLEHAASAVAATVEWNKLNRKLFTLLQCSMSTTAVRQSGSPAVRQSGSPAVWQSGSPAVRQSGSPAVRQSAGAPVRSCCTKRCGELEFLKIDIFL